LKSVGKILDYNKMTFVSLEEFLCHYPQAGLEFDTLKDKTLSEQGPKETSRTRINIFWIITIGKALILSLPFPPSHTVHESFPSHGVPSQLVFILICTFYNSKDFYSASGKIS